MMNRRRSVTQAMVLLLALVGFSHADAPAATTKPASTDVRFLRFTGDARSGGILETADVTYRNAAGDEIRLVAAVHIADKPYFDALNRSFRAADAVLYEMVKPKGAPPPRVGDPPADSGIAQLQHFLKNRLNLAFQLDVIDYHRPNFIHADMDAETFMAMQARRGESFASLMLSQMLEALANPSAGLNDPEQPQTMMELLARPDGERQFKLLIARQLGDLEASAMGLKGLNGTVILTERNKTVITALKDALADGKEQIAIFYGAAHMPDLAEQIEQMGFKPVGTTWHQAWDVKIRPNEPSAFEQLQKKLNQHDRPSRRDNGPALNGQPRADRLQFGQTPEAAQPPNILLILADDLGYGDLGSYGNRWHETVALDRLAKEGMRFTAAYACANCTPSRAALLTGKSAARTRLTFPLLPASRVERRNAGRALVEPPLAPGLGLEERTLAEALKAQGYTTGIIGKWHLGRGAFLPAHHGFDVVFGTDDAELPGSIRRWFGPDYGIPVENAVPGEYFSDRVTREAEQFLEANRGRPFFLYLPHYAVHSRHVGKREVENRFARKPGRPEGATPQLAAMLFGLDESVGRVLRKLDELNLTDSTLVVFMSDNGGMAQTRSNGGFRAGKGWLYEGGIRVPLFAKWPGKVRPGVVTDVPVIIEDLYPTLVEAAGGGPPDPTLDGVSFLPVLRGTGQPATRPIAVHMPHYADQGGFPGTALRWGDWKVIENLASGTFELFNLREDPAEAHDRAADQPKVLADMQARLRAWRRNVGAQMMTPAKAAVHGG